MANDNNIQPMADDSQIVLYQPNESVKLEVKLDATHETVWLTQQQIDMGIVGFAGWCLGLVNDLDIVFMIDEGAGAT